MSRRSMLGRVGKGAVAAGLAAWAVPEILVATPAGASGLSGEPTAPGSGSGGMTNTGGPGASGGTSASGASSPGGPAAAGSSSGGSPLAFTGSDVETMLGAGAALVSGGWVISRWASRQGGATAPEGTTSASN